MNGNNWFGSLFKESNLEMALLPLRWFWRWWTSAHFIFRLLKRVSDSRWTWSCDPSSWSICTWFSFMEGYRSMVALRMFEELLDCLCIRMSVCAKADFEIWGFDVHWREPGTWIRYVEAKMSVLCKGRRDTCRFVLHRFRVLLALVRTSDPSWHGLCAGFVYFRSQH